MVQQHRPLPTWPFPSARNQETRPVRSLAALQTASMLDVTKFSSFFLPQHVAIASDPSSVRWTCGECAWLGRTSASSRLPETQLCSTDHSWTYSLVLFDVQMLASKAKEKTWTRASCNRAPRRREWPNLSMRPPRLRVPANSTVRAEDLLLLHGQLRPFAVSSAGIDAFRPAPFSGPSSRSCLPFEPGSSRVQTQIRPMMRRFRVPFASFVTCGDGWCNTLHVHHHGVVLCCALNRSATRCGSCYQCLWPWSNWKDTCNGGGWWKASSRGTRGRSDVLGK